MARLSSLSKLPLDVRIELKRRLRAQTDTQLGLTAWLNNLGYDITKSALNRFAMRLEEEDKARGIDREFMVKGDVDLLSLFEELSDLKAREAEIIIQIQNHALGVTGNQGQWVRANLTAD